MNANKSHVAIFEDDADFRDFLRRLLEVAYDVVVARDGADLRRMVNAGSVDVVLLDIGLGSENGLSIARRIRSESGVPLIFLSGFSSEDMIVKGLALGADDYITKPCSSKVLVARIENALRRKPWCQAAVRDDLPIGEVMFDVRRRSLTHADGRHVILTEKEAYILEALAQAPNQTLSRDALYRCILGREWDCETRVLEVHVSNLREKLTWVGCDRKTLVALRGHGYRLCPAS